MSHRVSCTVLAFATMLLTGTAPAALAASTKLESVNTAGEQQNGYFGGGLAISGDGGVILFGSDATNLVAGAGGGDVSELFVRDRRAGTTTLAAVNKAGEPANVPGANNPVIARNGRLISFTSGASNLVPGDTPDTYEPFLRNLRTGWVGRAVIGPNGRLPNKEAFVRSLSPDGRFVVFSSRATNLDPNAGLGTNIYVRDRQTDTVTVESVRPDGGPADQRGGTGSTDGRITPDGRYLAFRSTANTLVAGDTNRDDIFVRDRTRKRTRLVSVAVNGGPANGPANSPHISDDGNLVAFYSSASNLVPGDTNNEIDVFARDLAAGTTTRVSVGPAGLQGNNDSFIEGLSADGRYVLFTSEASNLVPDDTNDASDMFLHDRNTGTTSRVSVNTAGRQANGASFVGALSADGSTALFSSDANNLVPDDDNDTDDVFVRVLRAPN